jgi:hypothetical protein
VAPAFEHFPKVSSRAAQRRSSGHNPIDSGAAPLHRHRAGCLSHGYIKRQYAAQCNTFLHFFCGWVLGIISPVRKHPFPEIDRAIARHLAELRSINNSSRTAIAKRASLDPDVIERIELGRMPLRYGEATTLLPALASPFPIPSAINPLWLAYEIMPPWLHWPFALPHWNAIGIHYNTPFSEFVTNNREVLEALAKDPPDAILPESWLPFCYLRWRELLFTAAHVEMGIQKLGRVLKSSAERLAPQSEDAARILSKVVRLEKIYSKKVLTYVTSIGNMWGMKSEIPDMQELVQLLRTATMKRGMKSSLARAMDVDLPRISEWLAGSREPSGETTLRLLQWVELQERQQHKSPGSALTRPEPKTQSTQGSNEKRKSNPSKS